MVSPPALDMSSLSFGFDVGYSTTIAGAIILVVLAVHLVPYVVDRRGMRSIPGPWLAKFSDAWLGRISARGHKSDVIRELHRQYGASIIPKIASVYLCLRTDPCNPPRFVGTFLRIAPNHVSIAKPEALRVIYGHSTGGLKAPYYDATSAKRPSTFASRNPVEHSRKRKMVSDIFSLKSVLEYEPNIRIYAEGLVRQWDKLAESGKKGLSGDEGNGWFGRDGRVWCDALPCEPTPSGLDLAEPERSHSFLRLQGTITSRSILLVISPSVPPSICSRPHRMYSPWSSPTLGRSATEMGVPKAMLSTSLSSRLSVNVATSSVHWAISLSGPGPS